MKTMYVQTKIVQFILCYCVKQPFVQTKLPELVNQAISTGIALSYKTMFTKYQNKWKDKPWIYASITY